jgi:hypothetical protein
MCYHIYEPLDLGCLLLAAGTVCRQGGWRTAPTIAAEIFSSPELD